MRCPKCHGLRVYIGCEYPEKIRYYCYNCNIKFTRIRKNHLPDPVTQTKNGIITQFFDINYSRTPKEYRL